MKNLFAILLSVVVVIVNAQFGLQIAVYEVFKPSIIEEFCVNKDVPDSTCEAMCHMTKVAEKDTKNSKETTNSSSTIEIKLIEADFKVVSLAMPALSAIDIKHNYPKVVFELLQSEIPTLDAPPKA